MSRYRYPLVFVYFCSFLAFIQTVELTFELADNDKQCFYEELKTDSTFVLEFQVVSGGDQDVDVQLKDPYKQLLYEELQKQYDHIERQAQSDGIYEICFSNEFSTFTHKVIYIDWRVDGDPEHEINGTRAQGIEGPLTLMETSVEKIHLNLEKTIDYQTHHRLREATGRARAEDLQERVQIWSLGQFILIIIVAIGTVLLLRSFFTDRRTSSMTWHK